jgi:hypothetical protein
MSKHLNPVMRFLIFGATMFGKSKPRILKNGGCALPHAISFCNATQAG